ncbi:class I SAM-dependent methyltransferase [Maritalea sp.]|uniref:class I SAM-dependent methyltransferase n=1 Tax=Maritalea sp. TaxID=2003361 RepID=UPI003EF8DFFD
MPLPIGKSFKDAEVVDLYLKRPPYPAKLFDLLVEHAPSTQNVLDLGCGHGKIARPLTTRFQNVTAIDPSARMIALGKTLENGKAKNLTWTEDYAETANLSASYDVIVAALSIHWMDHATLFPKLLKHAKPNHLFAVIEGDQPHNAPWKNDWHSFLEKWVPIMTEKPFIKNGGSGFWDKYLEYVEVNDEFELISDPIVQSIDDFILCQHSRDTFTISKLGDRRERFDAELGELLANYADESGNLTFRSCTKLTTSQIAT